MQRTALAFALALAAPHALFACIGSSNAPRAGGVDAGGFNCDVGFGSSVVACPDAAPPACGANAARALACADASSPPADAGSPVATDGGPTAPAAEDGAAPPDASGDILWATGYPQDGVAFGAYASDPEGNFYVAGGAPSPFTFATGFTATGGFVAKIDATGAFQWLVNTNAKTAYGIARDPVTGALYATLDISGQVTIGGTQYTARGADDLLLVKLDANGNVVAGFQVGSATSAQLTYGLAAGGGRVTLSGSFEGPIGFDAGAISAATPQSGYVVTVDSSLNFVYAKAYGGSIDGGTTGSIVEGIALDSTGNVYAAGGFSGTTDFGAGTVSATSTESSDGFLVSLDPNGAYRWSQILATPIGGFGSIALDQAGNVAVGGYFGETGNFGKGPVSIGEALDGFVASYTGAGANRWVTTFPIEGQFSPYWLATDPWNEVVVTGWFQGVLTVGATKYTSNSEENGFLMKLDPLGNVMWSEQWMGGVDVNPQAVTVATTGDILVSGTYFGGPMVLSPSRTLTGAASSNYPFILLTSP
jgi:hypothetical protein